MLVREDVNGGDGTFALIVAITPGSTAAVAGIGNDLLRVNDRILRLQGVALSELTPGQTHKLLRSSR